MNMKIVLLDQENVKYFYGLDPFSYLDAPLSPEIIPLGAVSEGEEQDEPAGLIILESYPDKLLIRWLFVDPEKRSQGYGDALLSAAFEAAERLDKKAVAAMYGKEPERKDLCPKEREYFQYHGFDSETVPGDYGEPMSVIYMDDVDAHII